VDRLDAGRELAAAVAAVLDGAPGGPRDVVVLGLPRGGVPVAAEVARSLGAPLDVVLVRKLGVPGHAELAMGAIGERDVIVRNDDVIHALSLTDEVVEEVARRERTELARRSRRYRGGRAAPDLRGRTVVIVDDGIATGATASAACRVVRAMGAARVVLAVPVAPAGWRPPAGDVDEIVALLRPADFHAVGQWYDDFAPTSDDEVTDTLARAGRAAT
jgi:predicted phosphoribosyltransferase